MRRAEAVRVTVLVSGQVQGVGLRYWVREQAATLGLSGSATNLRDGRVEVVVEGPRADCEAMLTALRGGSTPGAVTGVDAGWGGAEGLAGFRVR